MARTSKSIPEDPVYLLRATLSDFDARERGRPYRLLAVVPDTSLYDLAAAINDAFSFDFDHAFGFYNHLHNPYQADERYELFVDLEVAEAQEGADEVTVAIMGAFAALDAEALQSRVQQAVREAMQAELLTHIPEPLQNQARERLPELLDKMAEEAIPDFDEEFGESDEEYWDKPPALGVQGVVVGEAFDRVGKKLLYLFDYGDEWRFIVKFMRAEEAEAGTDYPQLVESVGEAPEQYADLEDEEADEAW